MAFRNLKYYLKSAGNSFVRNGFATFTSLITVLCCLLLFGVFLLFTMNINYVSRQIESQCEIKAYMFTNVTDETVRTVYDKISSLPNVKEAKLETKDQAFDNYQKMLGENAEVLEGLEGKDFLRSSIEVTLDDIRSADATVEKIEKIRGVEDVSNRQDIFRKVVKFSDIVERGSLVAMLVLLFVAVVIIQNTIKLSVNARGKELHIMKFVGATDHFIRTPFVIEGIMIAFLGFIFSFLIIVFAYTPVIDSIGEVMSMFKFVGLQDCIIPLGISMAILGIIMGAVGSGISVKRHLKV